MTDERVSHSSPAGERRGSSARGAGSASLPVVALVGFMGAGKTTVGRALAERLGWRFEDLDDRILAHEDLSIERIFREQGEAAFRELERLMLRKILMTQRSAPLVLALGGGAFPEEKVREELNKAGIPVVFLDAAVEELFRRSEQPEVVRPLRQDPEHFRQLYERRRPAYLQAQLRIETGSRGIAAVVEEIVSGLNLLPVTGSGSEVGE